jgi:hypothetical protein
MIKLTKIKIGFYLTSMIELGESNRVPKTAKTETRMNYVGVVYNLNLYVD